MNACKKELALLLAESGALYFADGLHLKDGRPTPYFVNFGLFRTGRLISELGRIMAGFLADTKTVDDFDVLVGPSYKGSALAAAVAADLWKRHQADKGFDYDRKEAKTHGEGSASGALFVTGALFDGARVLIIDDVATTMTTKLDLLSKLTSEAVKHGHSYRPAGVCLFLDREQTTAVYDSAGIAIIGQKGQNAIKNFKVKTSLEVQVICGIREIVEYLHNEKVPVLQRGSMQPLSSSAVDELFSYLDVYGV
jgi:orotate phosphoribosyltransferase